jgi:hypothetical protein
MGFKSPSVKEILQERRLEFDVLLVLVPNLPVQPFYLRDPFRLRLVQQDVW